MQQAAKMVLVCLLATALLIGGCWRPQAVVPGPWERTELVLDTVVRIVAYGEQEQAAAAIEAAFAEFRRIEKIFSFFDETSELSEINRSYFGTPMTVSDDMAVVLENAILLGMKTGGAFDPTIGSVTALWRIAEREQPPDPDEIMNALQHVGYDRLYLDFQMQTVQMSTPGMKLDLGGIAKGYAVDRAIAVLENEGISAGMVVAGGSIRVLGKKPGPVNEWVIGVQHPRQRDEFIAELMVTDQAVDSAGDYQRFFVHDGNVYHHIIDPTTGVPAEGAIAVTIIAADAVTADGLATGVFVLGVEDGMELVESLPGVEALIVGPDGRIITSSGFQGRVLRKQIDL